MRIDPVFLNQDLRLCLRIKLLIEYKTKINGTRRKCLLTQFRDGSCRIISVKRKFWFYNMNEVEELYSTEDELESALKVNEILYAGIDPDDKSVKITNFWINEEEY